MSGWVKPTLPRKEGRVRGPELNKNRGQASHSALSTRESKALARHAARHEKNSSKYGSYPHTTMYNAARHAAGPRPCEHPLHHDFRRRRISQNPVESHRTSQNLADPPRSARLKYNSRNRKSLDALGPIPHRPSTDHSKPANPQDRVSSPTFLPD